MLIKARNEAGFGGVLDFIVALVIVLLIGTASWYVYTKNHNPTVVSSSYRQSASASTLASSVTKKLDPWFLHIYK